MHFDTNFRPENICHEDKTRANITTVELVKEATGHYLVATNGVSLIKVPCTGVDDNEACGPVQPEAFELARKLAKKAKSDVAEIRCGRDLLTFADGSTAPRVSHGDARFPDYQRAIPVNRDTRHLFGLVP
jgi:DNA polymerase III sliding clamp (beta) subunit (PCNA family)